MSEWKLDEYVDEEGCVDDSYQCVETYYCPLEAILETPNYLRVVGDNGDTNVEIRIPVEAMKLNGWTPPPDYLERMSEGRQEDLWDFVRLGPDGKPETEDD